MAIENSDFVHAMAQVTDAPMVGAIFNKNVGFLSVEFHEDGYFIYELEQRIQQVECVVCVTPIEEGAVVASQLSSNGAFVYVWMFDGAGAASPIGHFIVVYRVPNGYETITPVEFPLDAPTWSGGGGAPSGPAGGDLSGTYPDPEVAGLLGDSIGPVNTGETIVRQGDGTWLGAPYPPASAALTPIAMGLIAANGAILNGYNILSVNQPSTGQKDITLDTPAADGTMCVVLATMRAPDEGFVTALMSSASVVSFQTRNMSEVLTNVVLFFTVFEVPAS